MKRDLTIMSSWAIRYFVLFFVFFLFPAFVFLIARNYENAASGIVISGQSSSTVAQASAVPEESRILTQEEASTLQEINDGIQGDWISQEDSEYVLRMKSGNEFDEIYKGKKFGWGNWRAFSGQSSSFEADTSSVGSSSFPTKPGLTGMPPAEYYIQRVQLDPDSKGEKFLYQIYRLNGSALVLIRTDNSKILPFVRSTSTAQSSSAASSSSR